MVTLKQRGHVSGRAATYAGRRVLRQDPVEISPDDCGNHFLFPAARHCLHEFLSVKAPSPRILLMNFCRARKSSTFALFSRIPVISALSRWEYPSA